MIVSKENKIKIKLNVLKMVKHQSDPALFPYFTDLFSILNTMPRAAEINSFDKTMKTDLFVKLYVTLQVKNARRFSDYEFEDSNFPTTTLVAPHLTNMTSRSNLVGKRGSKRKLTKHLKRQISFNKKIGALFSGRLNRKGIYLDLEKLKAFSLYCDKAILSTRKKIDLRIEKLEVPDLTDELKVSFPFLTSSKKRYQFIADLINWRVNLDILEFEKSFPKSAHFTATDIRNFIFT